MSTLPETPDTPLARTQGADPDWVAGRNFVMVHLDLVEALGGSYAAAALFDRIGFRAGPDGWWAATREQMAADTRLSGHVVKRALQELRDAGMVESQRVSAFDPTLRWRTVVAGQPREVENPLHGRGNSSVTVMGKSAITSVSKNVRTIPPPPEGEGLFGNPSPEPLRPASLDVDALFAEWYDRYPRKVGRGQARKAYGTALRKPGVTAQVLLDGLAAALPDLTSREAAYRPHPASWLNGERWADEALPVPPTGHGVDYSATTPEQQEAFLRTLPPPRGSDLYG